VNKATTRYFVRNSPRRCWHWESMAWRRTSSRSDCTPQGKKHHPTCRLFDSNATRAECPRRVRIDAARRGRKTANVILNTAFGEATMAVDRIYFGVESHRVGPRRRCGGGGQLLKFVPREFLKDAHHWLILHGRYVCKARIPACPSCLIADLRVSS